jgi:hypothetical protein
VPAQLLLDTTQRRLLDRSALAIPRSRCSREDGTGRSADGRLGRSRAGASSVGADRPPRAATRPVRRLTPKAPSPPARPGLDREGLERPEHIGFRGFSCSVPAHCGRSRYASDATDQPDSSRTSLTRSRNEPASFGERPRPGKSGDPNSVSPSHFLTAAYGSSASLANSMTRSMVFLRS